MIYLTIGLILASLLGVLWLYVLGRMLFEAARGYIKDEPKIKPDLFYAIYPKAPTFYHWEREDIVRRLIMTGRINESNIQQAPEIMQRQMSGEHIAGWLFIGMMYVVGTILAWPITGIILSLKGMRMYNTQPQFTALFERSPREAKAPRAKKEKVIKGLE